SQTLHGSMYYRLTCLILVFGSSCHLFAQLPGFPDLAPPPFPFSKDAGEGNGKSPADIIQSALSGIGDAPSPETLLAAIGKQLASDNPIDRLDALFAAGREGRVGPQVAASLQSFLREGKSPLERVLAANALVESNDRSANQLALKTLVESLRSSDPFVAAQSAKGLRAMGAESQDAFVGALKSPEASTRSLAAEALGEMAAPESATKLLPLLEDANGRVRVAAAKSLGATGNAQAAVPLLDSLRNDPELAVRANAAASLLELRPRDASIGETLVEAMLNEDEPIGLAVIRSLANCQAKQVDRANLLGRALPQAKPVFASELISHLVEMDESGMQALIRSLDQPGSNYWAVVALSDFGPQAKSASDKLAELLEESTPDVQTEILLTLANIRSVNEHVSNAVGQQLVSDQDGVRYAATLAAVRLGLKGDAIEARLQANATSNDKVLALVSSFALAKLNPHDVALGKRVLSSLVAAVRSGDERLKPLAQQAIAELRPKNLPSFPKLP
ncbi:MAG: HEAT repeat domain-containing protein, partial [Planctomycetota bacterium]